MNTNYDVNVARNLSVAGASNGRGKMMDIRNRPSAAYVEYLSKIREEPKITNRV